MWFIFIYVSGCCVPLFFILQMCILFYVFCIMWWTRGLIQASFCAYTTVVNECNNVCLPVLVLGGLVCSSPWALCWRGWGMRGWLTSSRPSRRSELRGQPWCRQRYDAVLLDCMRNIMWEYWDLNASYWTKFSGLHYRPHAASHCFVFHILFCFYLL